MLQIKNINKTYKTGELTQKALDDVSLNLRDNEFVSILGKSGSGKSTLLNIIGGLDRYESGDLIINNISTKNYKDKDWDSYRNHSVGFVFQSYNLIPHQSALANVELALTISGISRSKRQARAKEVLEKVGLSDQINKKPNQMSGGQMQRVAIARALINDPDILLADEPTGALDSSTSVQIMELMKEVAKDKLVIMVTHNKELAETYSTRIVKLKDGKIIDDSDPFDPNIEKLPEAIHKNMGKSKMSFLTSLALSFNNLKTKKGRTFLTAFAGSIGIIGIALILSLSTSVDKYISNIQKDTMSSYPIVINSESFDLNFGNSPAFNNTKNDETTSIKNGVYADPKLLTTTKGGGANLIENNLTEFKKYLDDPNSKINEYIGKNGVKYEYNVSFNVYSYDTNKKLINTSADPDKLTESKPNSIDRPQSGNPFNQGSSENAKATNFSQLTDGNDGQILSELISENYGILSGKWPSKYEEVVLVLDKNNSLSPATMYQLGIITSDEYVEIVDKISAKEEAKEMSFDYNDILNKEFYLLPSYAKYTKNNDDTFSKMDDNSIQIEDYIKENGIKLKIVGIIKPLEDSSTTTINTAIAYTSSLTKQIIEKTNNSEVVIAQKEKPEINVLNGIKFKINSDEEKAELAKEIINDMGVSEKANTYQLVIYLESQDNENSQDEAPSVQGFAMDEITMANAMDYWLEQAPKNDILNKIFDLTIEESSYNQNMKNFGNVDIEKPSSINIYTDSFENKNGLNSAIEEYNESVEKENKIIYTDYVDIITSSVSTIIDTISYILIAFVAVSLLVSSIMIGIITHISVLERTKEIGILRALGASKRNISQVFNAETFIIGCFSGILGILIAYFLTFPINAIIENIIKDDLEVSLPLLYALTLILLSITITIIGGLLPAHKAAKKDPVEALRTE